MATYKMAIILERTNVSPSPALNTPESLSDDITQQLAAKMSELGASKVAHYQLSAEKAGGRRHYFLLEI